MTTSTLRISKDEAIGEHGMVASRDAHATHIGLDLLKRGGNAVDAAVSMAFTLSVVEPASSGLGGGGMMVVHEARSGRTVAIDYAMDAPLAAGPDTFVLDPNGGSGPYSWPRVKGDANAVGYRAVAVPGMLRGMELALAEFGTISLAEAIGLAICFADEGFTLDWYGALNIAKATQLLSRFPATAEIFLPGGYPIPPGTHDSVGPRLIQADLAQTLRLIAAEGADAFYRGPIARAIVTAMRENGGLISEEDLARYQASLNEPLTVDYHGHRVFGVPGACGGITVLQALSILNGYDLASTAAGDVFDYHVQAESMRRAFADRYRYVADPKQVVVPWQGMLSKDYARTIRDQIDLDRATAAVEPGDPWPFETSRSGSPPFVPNASGVGGDGSTTHLCVADQEGNVVALTQTHVANFGSGVVIPGTGVVLNNAMAWFDPAPGRANSLASGKRGLNNMAPVIVTRDGRPVLALGAAGGRRIIQAVTSVLVNIVDHRMGIQEAIAAPRIDCSGPSVVINARVSPEVRSALESLGHRLDVAEDLFNSYPWALAIGILVEAGNGRFHGGVDPVRPASAEGY